ncbi:unnamed protein product [Sphagnum compactum]
MATLSAKCMKENQMGNCGADDRVAAAAAAAVAGDDDDGDDDGVYKRCCKVGVIGAGAGGLVTARELIREGHSVVVFEKSMTVGGVWVYEPEVDSELLGVKSDRKRVHSSMYASLRTNLPRELMSYVDYPFLPSNGRRRDGRRYPGHQEVAFYLQDFAQECELLEFIRFGVSVEHVELEMDRPDGEISWKVTTRRRVVDGFEEVVEEEVFDAVVVCSGHFSEPRIADIPGIDTWPGKEMHSHNYRDPQSFTDKSVVVIGTGASSDDISRELAEVAKEVHVSGRSWKSSVEFAKPVGRHQNIWLHSTVKCACEDGTVEFEEGGSTVADVILHCTGYYYYYPFLDTKGLVTADNKVGPLYEHVFPPTLAPSLSFVGLPQKVIPFPLSQLQARWIAKVLSGKVQLPSQSEMMKSVQAFYAQFEASGSPMHHLHYLQGDSQFEYDDWLADQTGSEHLETWRLKMYAIAGQNRSDNPETYRDIWPDDDLLEEALSSLRKLDTNK